MAVEYKSYKSCTPRGTWIPSHFLYRAVSKQQQFSRQPVTPPHYKEPTPPTRRGSHTRTTTTPSPVLPKARFKTTPSLSHTDRCVAVCGTIQARFDSTRRRASAHHPAATPHLPTHCQHHDGGAGCSLPSSRGEIVGTLHSYCPVAARRRADSRSTTPGRHPAPTSAPQPPACKRIAT